MLDSHAPECFLKIGDKKPLLLILDGVTDPHNLGACLRVADGAGADAIIVPKDRSAQLNSTVSKVASGASETMPFVAVTNLARAMRELQDAGVWLIGTSEDAEKTLYDIDLSGPIAISIFCIRATLSSRVSF